MHSITNHSVPKHRGTAIFTCAITLFLLFFHDTLFAASGTQDIKGIAEGVAGQLTAVAKLLVVVAYVAGVGFALAGVVQFKAHKDNPVQVPLSKPIVYLVVGACLLFLPTVMKSAGTTIFQSDKQVGTEDFEASSLN